MRRNVWTRCWEVGRSEFLPLVVLTAVSLQLISPFLTQRFIGNSDAEWYYCLLSDYVHQTRAGVFPVYVGQSTANWNGHPTVLLPGYLLTGAAIDFVTGGSLAVTQVQHLTLAWSIWVASLSAYCCLRALPTRRWLAVALACLYVSCPGVLSLPARLDMYPSFISAPYIPLLFYGLIRSARRPDATAVALVGGGLALIWMSHAAIALWCTTLTALFLSGLAVFSGRFWQSIRFAVQSGALFAVLSAWYFGSIFSTGAHHSHNADKGVTASSGLLSATGPGYADMVMSTLAIPIPDIYLPLDADFDPLSGFQLGYTLLSVFLLAAITAIRTRILELRLLVALALGLLLVVHPIPWVTWHFWANLPRQFNITSPWPMQRFYIILAGIGVFAGAITAEWVLARRHARLLITLRPSGSDADARQHTATVAGVVMTVLLLIGLGYSFHQAQIVGAWTNFVRGAEDEPPMALPENQPIHRCNWIALREPRTGLKDGSVGDPVLYDRLLARGDHSVLVANEDAARRGAAAPFTPDVQFPFEAAHGPVRQLLHFRLEPGRRYLLTLRVVSRNAYGAFSIEGGTLRRAHRPLTNTGAPQTAGIPIWSSSTEPQDVRVSLEFLPVKEDQPCFLRINEIALSSYDAEDLPVRVRSLMPYHSVVRADRPCDLETHRQYVPGYEAEVNGQRVETSRSPEGMLLVPLQAGENDVKLAYRGTPVARATFVLSGAAWIALLGCGALRLLRRASRPEQPILREAGAEPPQ